MITFSQKLNLNFKMIDSNKINIDKDKRTSNTSLNSKDGSIESDGISEITDEINEKDGTDSDGFSLVYTKNQSLYSFRSTQSCDFINSKSVIDLSDIDDNNESKNYSN